MLTDGTVAIIQCTGDIALDGKLVTVRGVAQKTYGTVCYIVEFVNEYKYGGYSCIMLIDVCLKTI